MATKMERWTAELDALNTERAELLYKLLGNEHAHDWSRLRALEASDHPKLVDINGRIADHVARRPEE